MNCCVAPTAIEGFAGVTAIDTSAGAVTVSVVEPAIPPSVALIVEAPAFTPFAKPPVVIVATPGADEPHVTVLVRFCVLPPLYVPVAVNCCVAPTAMEGLAGVTAIDASASTMNPLAITACCAPVATVTVRAPCTEAGSREICAVSVVGVVTVTGPDAPSAAPPTDIPAPKFACVTPGTKFVYCPTKSTEMVCPANARAGDKETICAGGLTVRADALPLKKATPVEVVPAIDTL